MLQSLRENMKGPVAKVIIGLAVAAMVLFGVESLFVNSMSGSEVATVNGEEVSQVELRRAIEQQKSRLRQQFNLEESSDMLSDERLREPALMNLIRQKALTQMAFDSGMNVSPEIVKGQLVEAFSRDGEFNKALMNNYIASYGYTPATLAQSEAQSYVLRQLFSGLNQSEFITDAELNAMAAVARQKRSFATIAIPKAKVEEGVSVGEDEVKAYYDANPAEFTDPEKIALDYVEVSISELAKQQQVSEVELKAEYEREIEEFQESTEYKVSHILIEGDDAEKITEVQAKLANGETFSALAKTYSDDLGSKSLGGELGVLVEGAFPSAFEKAAKSLAVGAVSEPVKTDAGTHFIRLDAKDVKEVPTFESRKEALTAMLKEQKAASVYLEKVPVLEEVSFGASNLLATAEAVGSTVKSTGYFARGRGQGAAALPAVAEAAFGQDVYVDGQNSRVLEADGERALVIRIKGKQPSKIKPLEQVAAQIESRLRRDKETAELEAISAEVVAGLNAGKSAKAIAEESGYEFKEHKVLERGSADVNFAVSREVFSLPRPVEGVVVSGEVNTAQGLTVVVLNEVIDGDASAMPKEQIAAMSQQLKNQLASGSVEAFETAVFEGAKYSLK